MIIFNIKYNIYDKLYFSLLKKKMNDQKKTAHLFFLEIVKHIPLDFILGRNGKGLNCNRKTFLRMLTCQIARITKTNPNCPLYEYRHILPQKLEPYEFKCTCDSQWEEDCTCIEYTDSESDHEESELKENRRQRRRINIHPDLSRYVSNYYIQKLRNLARRLGRERIEAKRRRIQAERRMLEPTAIEISEMLRTLYLVSSVIQNYLTFERWFVDWINQEYQLEINLLNERERLQPIAAEMFEICRELTLLPIALSDYIWGYVPEAISFAEYVENLLGLTRK